MPVAVADSVSPPDFAAILTSLGVFSLAIAAAVGGIYKGIKEVKKGGEPTSGHGADTVLLDRGSLSSLADSSERLATSNRDIVDAVKDLSRDIERLADITQNHRETTRSQIEEQHRLRAATVDLVEMLRRLRG